MRILHTSDLHIGRYLYEYDLLPLQRHFFDTLYQTIQEQKIDTLLIAGDVYNRSIPSSEAVALLNENIRRLILELKINVFMIYGNHDNAKRLSFGKDLFCASGMYISGEYDGRMEKITLQDEHGDISFFLLPYFIPQEAKRFLCDEDEKNTIKTFQDGLVKTMEANQDQLDLSERNIVLAHGFFANLNMAEGEKEIITSQSETSVGGSDIMDANVLKQFDYVALGHIHAPQRVLGEHIRYSGSPLKYSISEENQKKSFTLIDIKEKGNMEITQIPIVPERDVCTLKGEFEELLNNPNPAIVEKYVFVHLEEKEVVLHAMQRLKRVYPYILGLDYALEYNNDLFLQAHTQTMKEKSLSELFEDFYRESKNQELSLNQQEIVASILQKMGGEEDETN